MREIGDSLDCYVEKPAGKVMENPDSTVLADSSGLRNFARFAQLNGIDLGNVLDTNLMNCIELAHTQSRIPARANIDSLELTSIICKMPTIGLELASWADLDSIGVLGLLMEACPNIEEALRVLAVYAHLESYALDALVEEAGDEIMFRHVFRVPGQYGHSQYAEGALLVAIRLMRMAAGESWSPLRVEFEHQAPRDLKPYKRHLRCPVEFGSERSAFFISKEDLDRKLPRGNKKLLSYLEDNLEKFGEPLTGSLETEVSRYIAANLAAGDASLAATAQAMGMQPRSLQRRLAEHGLSFFGLLSQIRREVVESFVRTERHPELMRLAYRLGYCEASNASRFLSKQFGMGLKDLVRQARIEKSKT